MSAERKPLYLTEAELEALGGHTPGPWMHNSEGDETVVSIPVACGQEQDFSVLGQSEIATTEDYTNARLIAAAPALLAEVIERRARDAAVAELVESAIRLEVAANTVSYCYSNRPENFAVALRELQEDADVLRTKVNAVRGGASE